MNLDKQIEALKELLAKGYELSLYRTKKLLNTYGVVDIEVSYIQSKKDNFVKDIILNNQTVHLIVGKKSWVNLLPSIYQDNSFLINFLFALQLTQNYQKEIVDNIDMLFIPEETIAIDWLFEWFGIKFGSYISEDSKRKYLYRLIELHKIRGTKKYLEDLVEILVKKKIVITEFEGYKFEVEILFNNETKEAKDELCKIVNKIINVEKPAFSKFLGIKNCQQKKINDIEVPIQQTFIDKREGLSKKIIDNDEFDPDDF